MAHVDRLQETQEDIAQQEQEAEAAAWEALRGRPPLDETAERSRVRRAIAVGDIITSGNIRPDLPDILALAESIQERGLLQAPLISETDDGYEVVAGARRLAALERLYGRSHEVECDVIGDIDEAERIAMMVVENEQRQEIEPLMTARALRDLIRLREHASAAELARSLGLSVSWVQSRLRLLDLPDSIQQRVADGDLSFTLADLLRQRVNDGTIDEEHAEELADAVADGEQTATSVRQQLTPERPVPAVDSTTSEWDDEWDRASSAQSEERAAQERSDALESQADALLSSSVGEPIEPDEDPASPPPAGSRSTALALAQLLAIYGSHARGLGIDDPWAQVPALSEREREEMLEKLVGRVWSETPAAFQQQFV